MIDLIIMALEEQIENLLIDCMNILWENWMNAEPSFNAGQQSLYDYHLWPEIETWMDESEEAWPWVDAYEYVDWCYAAYWADVVNRAFSDTIDHPVGSMEEKIFKAQELELAKEILEGMDLI